MADFSNVEKVYERTQPLDVDKTLEALTLEEKVSLLGGSDFRHSVAIARLGIPRIRISDSPVAVRGHEAFNGVPGSCFPCTAGLAASWDESLLFEIGTLLGDDGRSKGTHVLSAPTINLQRSPLGGRSFEEMGEDPYLCSRMAAPYVRGLQSRGIIPAVKHFICNDQEHERTGTNVIVSERTLREVYLRPYETVIREENPGAIMVAYNSVNGSFCNENKWLLDDLLRQEWSWNGLTVSDYFAVTSTAESVKAGVNIEMPAPALMRGKALIRVLGAFRLRPDDVDKNARRVLELVNLAVKNGVAFEKKAECIDGPARRAAIRRAAADCIVLLKNEKYILPLRSDKVKSVAVIGPNAKSNTFMGGGSATMDPVTHYVTFLDGVKGAVGEDVTVEYAAGCHCTRVLPHLISYLTYEGKKAMHLEFFNEDPWDPSRKDNPPKPAYEVTVSHSKFLLIDNIPSNLATVNWIRVSGTLHPDKSGLWEFGLVVAQGQGNLYIDGHKVIDNTENQVAGELFAMAGTIEETGTFECDASRTYEVELRFCNARPVPGTTIPMGKGAMQIGGRPAATAEELLNQAGDLARRSDVVICAVGLDEEYESEGFDRTDFNLPNGSDDLVKEVLRANPNAIIVTQAGSPVAMPWVHDAATLLYAYYGGSEFGNALADVLFGKVNPTARLSSTFPYKLEHTPAFYNWGDECGESRYGEGLFVGYRHFDATDREPMFEFGYGLSYHQSKITAVTIKDCDDHAGIKPLQSIVNVEVKLQNNTDVAGKEVIQVYLTPKASKLQRPVKELQAFTKVSLGPQESKTVSIPLRLEALAYWDPWRKGWVADAGKYIVSVGLSSRNIQGRSQFDLKVTRKWTRAW